MNFIQKPCAIAFAVIGLFGMVSESAFALTGTCTTLINYPITDTTSNSLHSLNVLATLNFDTSTINYNYSIANFPPSSDTNWTASAASGVPFTIAAGPITGSQTITFTRPIIVKNVGSGIGFPAKNVSWNIFPVNSGKTILVQGQNDNASGVCQY